jgi:hypothetical protein
MLSVEVVELRYFLPAVMIYTMYHQSPSYESIDDAQISERRQYNKIFIGDNDYPSVG